MIKYYCDRCEREVPQQDNLRTLSLSSYENTTNYYERKNTLGALNKQICEHCILSLKEWLPYLNENKS